MEPLWNVCLLLLSIPPTPAPTPPPSPHTPPPGLSCVSDHVRNITCEWNSTGVARGEACRIQASGDGCVDKSCALEPLGSPDAALQRCGFACTLKLNSAMRLKFLRVKCGETLVTELINFKPSDHIKMNPPGVPLIVPSSNDTRVSWGPGAPLSTLIFGYNFQVQIKQEHQQWEDSLILTQSMLECSLTVKMKEAGVYQVRVRVCPDDLYRAQWSDWSPTSSWRAEGDGRRTGGPDVKHLDWTSVVVPCVVVAVFTFIIVLVLVLCKTCAKKGKHHQHVPNPSRYFHALNSVHDGNFHNWLSPMFAAEAFLPALPCEDISLLEVAETVIPSTSTSTAAPALLYSGPDSPAQDWTGGESSGQSSSSCFSNISYFLSNYPTHLRVESCPVYFTYEEDPLHPLPWPSLTRPDSYELLLRPGTTRTTRPGCWKEPRSPDSGISEGSQIPSEDEESVKDVGTVQFNHPPPLLVPPLSRVACLMHQGGPPAPPGLSQAPSPPGKPPPNPEGDSSLALGGSYNAWPVDCTLARSSSMTTRPCGGGYLTIRELQTTYSKKSI
ncbi:interleukin-2 receptor subunit beta [Osmerus mordax]|uniref:interleukin-2 receptor subunit beta n=1 Tax=Osmerus mordax TaxID=8014 RepID=UPI003510A09C